MPLEPLQMLAMIVALGALAQWLGWLLRLPSILLLLLFGFLAGPVTGFVRPDALFGDALLPFVSISVALILFEGGLTLNLRELGDGGRVVLMLVTVGAFVTWALAATFAHLLIGLDSGLSILLGAILIVTGPTVVLPLLWHIRPSRAVNAILKWEGIVIDPIGAVAAVIAFEIVAESQYSGVIGHAALTVTKTLVFGTFLGLVGAVLLAVAVRRFWVPDHLHTITAAMFVVVVYAGANYVAHESGLMAVTVMGIALANQRYADMRPILEFKENLRVFLLSAVFVLLSARLKFSDFVGIGPGTFLFVATLMIIVRPACVFISSIGSKLSWREKAFISWMAPRGIVAAAITSVFALALEQRGTGQARQLVPIVFSTIVGTVLVYGLSGGAVARLLKLAEADPQGIMLLGGGRFARELALVLKNLGFRALLIDSNRANVVAAQLEGIETHYGSILAEDADERLDLSGIGRLLAMTSNDEVNSLAAQRFIGVFGRAGVFQIASKGSEKGRSKLDRHLQGRVLFGSDVTLARVEEALSNGATVRATRLTPEFDYAAFRRAKADTALPLLILTDTAKLRVMTADEKYEPRVGQTIIALAAPADRSESPQQTAGAGAA